MNEGIIEFNCTSNKKFTLIMQENHKVCYLYLLYKNKIICDLWLDNRVDNVEKTEWQDKGNIPFCMPDLYLNELYRQIHPINPKDLFIEWINSKNEKEVFLRIYYKKIVIGEIGNNFRVSYLINMNNPLASAGNTHM